MLTCTSGIHTDLAAALGDRNDMVLSDKAVVVIVEVGELVKDFKIGDKVLVAAITHDWNSLEAQNGFPRLSG